MSLVCRIGVMICLLLSNLIYLDRCTTAEFEAGNIKWEERFNQNLICSEIRTSDVQNESEDRTHIINCKGIEDITSKVTEALKEGGTIKISGGIGVVSQPLVIIKDDTHIIVDKNTVIRWSNPSYGVIIKTAYVLDKETILKNVSLEGGIWEMGGADISSGSNPAIMLIGINNLRVSNMIVYDAYKFFFGFGGIDGFDISNITMWLRNTSIVGKDGLHFAGGVRNGRISNIRGNTTDDLVALNFGGDAVGDSDSNMMYVGDSYNVKVTNVFSENAMQAIRLLADDVHLCTDITIDGVYGIVKNHSCISISGWMFKNHTAKFGKISLSHIHVQTTNTVRDDYAPWHSPVIMIGNHWDVVPCHIESLSIKECVITQTEEMLQTPIRILGNTTIESLSIDGLIVNSLENVDLGNRSVIDMGHKEQVAFINKLVITNSYIDKTNIPFYSLINIEGNGSKIGKTFITNNVIGTIIPKKSKKVIVKNNIILK